MPSVCVVTPRSLRLDSSMVFDGLVPACGCLRDPYYAVNEEETHKNLPDKLCIPLPATKSSNSKTSRGLQQSSGWSMSSEGSVVSSPAASASSQSLGLSSAAVMLVSNRHSNYYNL